MPEINLDLRVCCICGCTETSKWGRHKNRKGIWDGISYICKSCYELLRRYGTADKNKIEEYKERYNEYKKNKKMHVQIHCKICGNRETGKNFNGESHWSRYKGNDGKGVRTRIYEKDGDCNRTGTVEIKGGKCNVSR
jgi:hypothetical protein